MKARQLEDHTFWHELVEHQLENPVESKFLEAKMRLDYRFVTSSKKSM